MLTVWFNSETIESLIFSELNKLTLSLSLKKYSEFEWSCTAAFHILEVTIVLR